LPSKHITQSMSTITIQAKLLAILWPLKLLEWSFIQFHFKCITSVMGLHY